MTVSDVRINGITTGKKLKTFSLVADGEPCTFFGDDQATDSLDKTQPYNRYSMYDMYHGHIVHNMYRNDKLAIRSTTRVKHDQNTIEDFLNICLPRFDKSDIKKVVQNESYTYILTQPTISGFSYTFAGQQYSDELATYMYKSTVSCDQSAAPTRQHMLEHGDSTLEQMFTPQFSLQGISYNYVIEIPNEYVNGYFDDASILGDGINTKNHLGYDYRMHVSDNMAGHDVQISGQATVDVQYDGISGKVIDVIKTNGKYYIETQFAIYYADSLVEGLPHIYTPETVYDSEAVVKSLSGDMFYTYDLILQNGYEINCVETAGKSIFIFASSNQRAIVYRITQTDTGIDIQPIGNCNYCRAFKTGQYCYLQNNQFEIYVTQLPISEGGSGDPIGDAFEQLLKSENHTHVILDADLNHPITKIYQFDIGYHTRWFMIAGNDVFVSPFDVYNSFSLHAHTSEKVLDCYMFNVRRYAAEYLSADRELSIKLDNGELGEVSAVYEVYGAASTSTHSDLSWKAPAIDFTVVSETGGPVLWKEDLLYVLACEGKTINSPDLGSKFSYSHDFMKFSFESAIAAGDKKWLDLNFEFDSPIKYMEQDGDDLLALSESGTVYGIPMWQFIKYMDGNISMFNIIFDKNRLYTDIKKHGNEIYLKYVTTKQYDIKTISIEGSSYDISKPLSSFTQYDSQQLFNLSAMQARDSDSWIDAYQKIESIGSVNRFRLVQHKSNLYSIQIDNSGMDTIVDEKDRAMLKRDIEQNIKTIVAEVAPANTQFLNVKWNGK